MTEKRTYLIARIGFAYFLCAYPAGYLTLREDRMLVHHRYDDGHHRVEIGDFGAGGNFTGALGKLVFFPCCWAESAWWASKEDAF